MPNKCCSDGHLRSEPSTVGINVSERQYLKFCTRAHATTCPGGGFPGNSETAGSTRCPGSRHQPRSSAESSFLPSSRFSPAKLSSPSATVPACHPRRRSLCAPLAAFEIELDAPRALGPVICDRNDGKRDGRLYFNFHQLCASFRRSLKTAKDMNEPRRSRTFINVHS